MPLQRHRRRQVHHHLIELERRQWAPGSRPAAGAGGCVSGGLLRGGAGADKEGSAESSQDRNLRDGHRPVNGKPRALPIGRQPAAQARDSESAMLTLSVTAYGSCKVLPVMSWRQPSPSVSLPEVHGSVPVPTGSFWRKLFAFTGPGLPGRRRLHGSGQLGHRPRRRRASSATRCSASSCCRTSWRSCCRRCRRASASSAGRDLAQACRDHYSRPTTLVLWVLCEIAIAACDLAEVIGAAIALNLLFGLPMIWGVCLTSPTCCWCSGCRTTASATSKRSSCC